MIFRDSRPLGWCSPAWRGVIGMETLHGCTDTFSNQRDEVDGQPRLHTCRHSHPHEHICFNTAQMVYLRLIFPLDCETS